MMKKRLSSLVASFNGASCKSKKETDVDVYQAAQPTRARRRTAATVVADSGCRCVRQGRRRTRRSVPAIDIGEDDMSRARETPAYLWRKEEKWEEVSAWSEGELARRKTDEEEEADEDDYEDEDQDKVPLAIDLTKARRTRDMLVHQRRSLIRSRSRISTSSVDSSCRSSDDDDDDAEENYETEDGAEEDDNALLSALSLTSCTANSSSIAPPRNRSTSPEPRVASASAVGMLKKLVPCAADEGKVQESFAVVKKSEDPRGDFRRSMAEMVVEKGIYDAADLEQLLRCFLSLNSRHHHRAIVSAFSDIWQTLFPDNSPNFSYME